MREPRLEDTDNAEFEVTRRGRPFDVVGHLKKYAGDSPRPTLPKVKIKCQSCGSEKCVIDDSQVGMGSSKTGPYGRVEITCQVCLASKILDI